MSKDLWRSLRLLLITQRGPSDGKLYGYLKDNADTMRHIILALIALVALCGSIPAIMAEPAKPVGLSDKMAPTASEPENSLLTTPSMAAFLNDSWSPSTYTPDVFRADSSLRSWNGTIQNATYAIADFAKDNYTAPAATSPIYSAPAAAKNGQIAWTGESIYQFLDGGWTPSTPVQTFSAGEGYTLHRMS